MNQLDFSRVYACECALVCMSVSMRQCSCGDGFFPNENGKC